MGRMNIEATVMTDQTLELHGYRLHLEGHGRPLERLAPPHPAPLQIVDVVSVLVVFQEFVGDDGHHLAVVSHAQPHGPLGIGKRRIVGRVHGGNIRETAHLLHPSPHVPPQRPMVSRIGHDASQQRAEAVHSLSSIRGYARQPDRARVGWESETAANFPGREGAAP